jgi:hypothetical protein
MHGDRRHRCEFAVSLTGLDPGAVCAQPVRLLSPKASETRMADIINLNQVRKARAKAEAKAGAATNRAASGRTKAERTAAEKARIRAERLLDGQKRED